MSGRRLEQIQRVKELIWEAERVTDGFASEPPGAAWPPEAVELAEQLSATLHAAAVHARELYAASPRYWTSYDNVIEPSQWRKRG